MDGGHTTTYINLERNAHQGDLFPEQLFIPVLNILVIQMKPNKNIYGIKIFKHEYLCAAYVDDTIFL